MKGTCVMSYANSGSIFLIHSMWKSHILVQCLPNISILVGSSTLSYRQIQWIKGISAMIPVWWKEIQEIMSKIFRPLLRAIRVSDFCNEVCEVKQIISRSCRSLLRTICASWKDRELCSSVPGVAQLPTWIPLKMVIQMMLPNLSRRTLMSSTMRTMKSTVEVILAATN